MDKELKEKIARNAASEWCRCYKCDGIIRTSNSQCNKEDMTVCMQFYHGYRTALLALEDEHVKVIEKG